jgi:hypothetical protein
MPATDKWHWRLICRWMGKFKKTPQFLVSLLLVLMPFSAYAQSESWKEDKNVIEMLLSQKPIPCDRLWDTLWPWFKRGEPDVIAGLLMGSAGWGEISPPLSADKNQARTERFSMSAYEALARAGKLRLPVSENISLVPLKTVDDYLFCIHKYPEEDCAETSIAVGSIPAFDDFIKLIESRIEKGQKPVCPMPSKE